MEPISPESYESLKCFDRGLTVHDASLFNESCIEQLAANRFVESHISDYDLSGSSPVTVFSDYVITEKGRGYLAYRQYEEEFHNSIKKIAQSAETRSNIAIKTSKKADIKGWLSVFFTASGALVEFIIHFDEISMFFANIFK